MKFLKYILNYRENIEELDELTKEYDRRRVDKYKSTKIINELNKRIGILNNLLDKKKETIKKKNKQIKELKKSDKEV